MSGLRWGQKRRGSNSQIFCFWKLQSFARVKDEYKTFQEVVALMLYEETVLGARAAKVVGVGSAGWKKRKVSERYRRRWQIWDLH